MKLKNFFINNLIWYESFSLILLNSNIQLNSNEDFRKLETNLRKNFKFKFKVWRAVFDYNTQIGIIKNLVDSAILLSDNKFHHDNLNIVSKLLSLNSFPIQFIDKHIKKKTQRNTFKIKWKLLFFRRKIFKFFNIWII